MDDGSHPSDDPLDREHCRGGGRVLRRVEQRLRGLGAIVRESVLRVLGYTPFVPVLEGLMGRQNRTPTIVVLWSVLLASVFIRALHQIGARCLHPDHIRKGSECSASDHFSHQRTFESAEPFAGAGQIPVPFHNSLLSPSRDLAGLVVGEALVIAGEIPPPQCRS
ncbi:unnamed protein product [Linum tenue]|uniref:Uncharacterized protein n=1 Tax=Linum tenue TaxID=586396 RepID=A0AAV0NMH9_9ROSI|nr:unnamed protein product [Linum tenue]